MARRRRRRYSGNSSLTKLLVALFLLFLIWVAMETGLLHELSKLMVLPLNPENQSG